MLKNAQINLGGRIQICNIIFVILINEKKFWQRVKSGFVSWLNHLLNVYLLTNHIMVAWTWVCVCIHIYVYILWCICIYIVIYIYEMIICVYSNIQWSCIKDKMEIMNEKMFWKLESSV
jgi:hypothetical protein